MTSNLSELASLWLEAKSIESRATEDRRASDLFQRYSGEEIE